MNPRKSRLPLAALGALVAALLIVGVSAAVARFARTDLGPSEAAVATIRIQTLGGFGQLGTGMVVSPGGEVVTNSHVVASATGITVQVGSGRTYPATVVGLDPTDDIALLQLGGASHLPTVRLGTSAHLVAGQSVTALGFEAAASVGSITTLGQTVTSADQNGAGALTLSGLIEFSAPVRTEDCGGPVLDPSGAVIGMATTGADRVRLRTVGADTGFAIPIDRVISIVNQITSGASNPNILRSRGAFLGVDVVDMASSPGAVVTGVFPGGPADTAGMRSGDVIIAIDTTPVTSTLTLTMLLQQHSAGDRVVVVWLDNAGTGHTGALILTTAPTP